MTFFIDGIPPPTLNRALRAHWTQRRRQRDNWFLRVRQAMPRLTRYEDKVTITVTIRSTRLADEDGLGARCKFILDALKQFGVVADDDPAHVRLIARQERVQSRNQQGVRVEIESGEP